MKLCKVARCDNKVIARGCCNRHYRQLLRHGEILERTRYDINEIIQQGDYFEVILYNRKGEELKRALIDTSDKSQIKEHKWRLSRDGYAVTRIGGQFISMHRYLLNAPPDKQTDHINQNRTDNRRSNIRICTSNQNMMNIAPKKNNTSGATGVCWDKSRQRWVARVCIDNKNKHLGYYVNFDDAAESRKIAEEKYYGAFAYKHEPIPATACIEFGRRPVEVEVNR